MFEPLVGAMGWRVWLYRGMCNILSYVQITGGYYAQRNA